MMTITPEHDRYDAVIVGARVAGATTAMLLAEQGLRILAVDRQVAGSDTLSSHALMRGAVERLARWGLLDSVWAAGTPVISHAAFSYGVDDVELDISPEPGVPGLAAPRRTVLDPILVDAARRAGAEILHATQVTSLIVDDAARVGGVRLRCADGTEITVEADLVIGADGLRSRVAHTVGAPVTRAGAHASAYTMRYYTDLDIDRTRFRWMYRPGVGGGVIPTTGDAVCVFTGLPTVQFRRFGRFDIDRTHRANLKVLDAELAAEVDSARPVGPCHSFPGVPGQFRKPYGPGWALVGDAGYFKDPYAAHGISDAFRDSELLTAAIVTGDLAGYEALRDAVSMPLFHVLDQIASYDWDLETLPGLHHRLSKAMKAEDEATIDPKTPLAA